jgi:hypothetical protein
MRRWLALVLAAVGGLAPAGEARAGEEPFYAESFEKVPSAAAWGGRGRALKF